MPTSSSNSNEPPISHSLKGKHKDKSAVSLTYSHRIILILKVKDRELVLLDIGDRDTTYR